MSFLERFGSEVVGLFVESAPYLLFGFLLAGLLKVFLPKRLVETKLGGNDLRSIFRAALYGLPLPLCSCSVLPTAASLRRAGASRGATTSFLISTPETGVDSISVTYALFDPVMTLVRPLAAFLSAMVTGLLVAVGVREQDEGATEEHGLADHAHDHHDHGVDEPDWDRGEFAHLSVVERLKLAVRYAFGPLLDDLTPWFLVGFLLSGLVAALVPDSLFTEVVPTGWATMALMILIGTPIYICATASTPIAAALVAKGLDPGAALVFLLVGPATNVTTLLVVSKLLGRRTVAFYLAGIVAFALFAGLVTNALYLGLAIDLSSLVAEGLAEPSSPLAQVAAVAFVALLVKSAVRIRVWRWAGDGLARILAPVGVDPRTPGWRALGAVSGLLWLGTSCTTWVDVGERGWLVRFGKVVGELDEPGLAFHLPWPFARAELLRPEQLRRYEFGFRTSGAPPQGASFDELRAWEERLEAESQMLTGDDPPAILDLDYVAQLRIVDPERARFGVRDLDALARSLVEESVRRQVGSMRALDVLYRDQTRIVPEVSARLAATLAASGSGLELVGLELRDVHAPTNVHRAYREVASAEEDYETLLHEARAEVAALSATVATGSEEIVVEARIGAHRAEELARGRRDALDLRRAADEASPTLTRRALELELFGGIVKKLRLVVVGAPDLEVELYSTGDEPARAATLFGDLTGGAPITDPLRALGPGGDQH